MNAEERFAAISGMETQLQVIPPPGISIEKQNEMFSKWRQIVPKKYWAQTCPEPPPDILKAHKDNKKAKQIIQAQKKKDKKPQNPKSDNVKTSNNSVM